MTVLLEATKGGLEERLAAYRRGLAMKFGTSRFVAMRSPSRGAVCPVVESERTRHRVMGQPAVVHVQAVREAGVL
jgi:hypothetical protein